MKNDNFIYVVLNDLKTKRKLIESGERGKYRKCSPSSNQQFKDSCSIDKKERRQILNGWRDFYNNSINKYQVSLDMTEAEFRKAKCKNY